MERLSANEATKLDSLFGKVGKTVIVSHTRPDGDAAGSCVAMKRFLDDNYGGEHLIVLDNAVNVAINFLFEYGGVPVYFDKEPAAAGKALSDAGLIICLDVSGPARTGCLEKFIRASSAPKILFDHHLSPETEIFTTLISCTEVSSTCELLYDSLLKMPQIAGSTARLSLECLTALMTGITTDTNNFGNSVFPGTLEAVAGMLAAGVDREAIVNHVFNEYRENRIRLMGHLLASVMKITENGVAYIVLSGETSRKYDIMEGELEGIVNMPLAIKSVRMSIFVREDEGFLRVSIRSKRGTSANGIAVKYFNGGGHELASGGKLFWPKDIARKEDAEDYIRKVTGEYFRNES